MARVVPRTNLNTSPPKKALPRLEHSCVDGGARRRSLQERTALNLERLDPIPGSRADGRRDVLVQQAPRRRHGILRGDGHDRVNAHRAQRNVGTHGVVVIAAAETAWARGNQLPVISINPNRAMLSAARACME